MTDFQKELEGLWKGVILRPLFEEGTPSDFATTPYVMMQPMKMTAERLKDAYEILCNEYRRRLCVMWDFPFEESWWFADKVGQGLMLADWWMSLSMDEIRYCVENNVTWDAWMEYCDFCENEINIGHDRPRINFLSWFKGLRPEMLKD